MAEHREAKIGRRALMAGGLGLATLAATPAEACTLLGTRSRQRAYYSPARARALLERLVAAASRRDGASDDAFDDIGIGIQIGDDLHPASAARGWLVSEGRRDSEPAVLLGMGLLGEGRRERLYLVAVRRTAWRQAYEEDSCTSGSPEGFYKRVEAWLYNFAPDDGSSLRHVPELLTHLRAYVPEAREELSVAW
ncbi:MAG TPA: hypothetical protein VGB79_14215 [Allosphingosinicella sp.]